MHDQTLKFFHIFVDHNTKRECMKDYYKQKSIYLKGRVNITAAAEMSSDITAL